MLQIATSKQSTLSPDEDVHLGIYYVKLSVHSPRALINQPNATFNLPDSILDARQLKEAI